ncbi:hypothetical protein BLOT_005483 [Blomia tropicalis]|nr:hypothetical protein BLOT_005483 [Blomia tropicalis]
MSSDLLSCRLSMSGQENRRGSILSISSDLEICFEYSDENDSLDYESDFKLDDEISDEEDDVLDDDDEYDSDLFEEEDDKNNNCINNKQNCSELSKIIFYIIAADSNSNGNQDDEQSLEEQLDSLNVAETETQSDELQTDYQLEESEFKFGLYLDNLKSSKYIHPIPSADVEDSIDDVHSSIVQPLTDEEIQRNEESYKRMIDERFIVAESVKNANYRWLLGLSDDESDEKSPKISTSKKTVRFQLNVDIGFFKPLPLEFHIPDRNDSIDGDPN